MKVFTKFSIVGLVLMLVSMNAFSAQDYNSSRSNNDGVAVGDIDVEVERMIKKIHKDLSLKLKKKQTLQKGKGADVYRDVTVTMKAKISPSKNTRAQDYNSSRSNTVRASDSNLDKELQKHLSKMKKHILKGFHQKNKTGQRTGKRKGAKSSKKTPDSFFDIWVEVSIKEKPISRKTQQ